MFQIYQKNTLNKNAQESFYSEQKPILELVISSNNIRLIKNQERHLNSSIIQNYSPNTRDYQILLEEYPEGYTTSMNNPKIKLTFSNLSFKLEIKCWNEVEDYITIQIINNLKNFEHSNLGLLSDKEHVFVAFSSFVKGSEFIKELHNAFLFAY